MAAIETNVIEPVRLVQEIIDAHPYVTRLYSTMSASEMTADPLFTFNADLADVSNLHTAERIIECNPEIFQSEAPWRIELPQGGVVRGTADQVGTWPDFTDQPANFRILRQGDTGDGRVIEDNSSTIDAMLEEYNDTIPGPSGTGGSSGTGNTSGTGGADSNGADGRSDSGCTMQGRAASSVPWAALALVLLARHRRRARRS
jgi:MYXO-CTERM domain-containing protein